MNTSGEAADQVVRMMLEGSEVLIKLSGSGAKNAAVLLYSILREQKKTNGAARLSNMLRSGKPLKVYTFKDRDLAKFKEVAKEYGVLYTVLKDKDKTDGVFDVLVRADDESKINRIVERFKLSQVDTATLRAQVIKEKAEKEQAENPEAQSESEAGNEDKEKSDESDIPEPPRADGKKDEQELDHPELSAEDRIVEDLMRKDTNKETPTNANPAMARADLPASVPSTSETESPSSPEASVSESPKTDRPSEPFSEPTRSSEGKEGQSGKKPSVRKKMEDIRRRRAEEEKSKPVIPVVSKEKSNTTKER